jgi:hypothetical protein
MRGALRDPDNHEAKRVFVPDLGTSEWLLSLFPGAKLRKLETDFHKLGLSLKRGRKRVYGSDGERKRASRGRQRLEQRNKEINELRTLLAPTEHELQNIKIHQSGHDMSIYTNSNFVTGFTNEFRGSLFFKIDTDKPFNCYVTKTIGDFEKDLEEAFTEAKYDKKEDNFLICPSAFDPDKAPDTKKGKANVVFASGIWLDFNGGGLQPLRFSKIFSTLRMTIYSSFSSTKKKLRFRVYIPTDNILSVQQYGVITKELAKAITVAGFHKAKSKGKSKLHGLDTTKLHAVSHFYFPCRPKDPSGAYFKVFNGKPREPLVVQDWIEKYLAEEETDPFVKEEANSFIETPIEDTQFEPQEQETCSFIPHEGSGVDRDAVERACSEWQQCPQGEGDHGFFTLGLKLAGAGCDPSEIASILKEEAPNARSPNERLTQIPSILQSLRAYSKV